MYFLAVVDALSYRTKELPVTFYIAKVIYGVVWVTASAYWVAAGKIEWQLLDNTELALATLIVVALIVSAALFFIYIIWVLCVMRRTAKRLARVPYLSVRWRQLTFRFVTSISITMFVYFAVYLVRSLFFTTNTERVVTDDDRARIDSTFFYLSTMLLLSAYVYSLAYVFLPARAGFRCPSAADADNEALIGLAAPTYGVRRKQTRRFSTRSYKGRFCLEEAALCLELSFQSYFDLLDKPTTSGFGTLDAARLEQYGLTIVDILHDDGNDTHVIVGKTARAVYVSMRGTASFENARTDLNMKLVDLPHPDSVSVFPPPRVHRGFMQAFTAIWPLVQKTVEDTHRSLVASAPQGVRIDVFCTGHSLGGALATLCALFLSWRIECRIALYSFGAPRVGSHSFARMFNRCVPDAYRVVCGSDLVTGGPKFGVLFKHSSTEVCVDRRGNVVTDMSYIEKFFRPSKTSLKDHRLDAYRAALVAAFRKHKEPELALALSLDGAAKQSVELAARMGEAADESSDDDEDFDSHHHHHHHHDDHSRHDDALHPLLGRAGQRSRRRASASTLSHTARGGDDVHGRDDVHDDNDDDDDDDALVAGTAYARRSRSRLDVDSDASVSSDHDSDVLLAFDDFGEIDSRFAQSTLPDAALIKNAINNSKHDDDPDNVEDGAEDDNSDDNDRNQMPHRRGNVIVL